LGHTLEQRSVKAFAERTNGRTTDRLDTVGVATKLVVDGRRVCESAVDDII
jgi:hypothetical protein